MKAFSFFKRNPKKIQQATLCYLVRKEGKSKEVLLALKKRGFGQGRFNGSGGKAKPKESIKKCLSREVFEEVKVKIDLKKTTKVALLHFYFPEESIDWNQDVHVFVVEKWKGRPSETEEMRPKWFKVNNLPFKKMWPDDPFWLPLVLNGEKVEASFKFEKDGQVGSYKIEPLLP